MAKTPLELSKDVSNPFNLSDDNIRKDIRPSRSGSLSQEVGSSYENISDRYGLDFDSLVYGDQGFMKTKYPQGFPDFKGDVIYSEKYWNELDNWFKENTGMSLADRENYVKAKRKELYGADDDYESTPNLDKDGLPF